MSIKKKRRKLKKPDNNLNNKPLATKYIKNKRRKLISLNNKNIPFGSALKKVKIIKITRFPPIILFVYNINYYTLYLITANNVGVKILNTFKYFKNYDGYTLYINPILRNDEVKIANISRFNVRLNNKTVGFILINNFNKKKLN